MHIYCICVPLTCDDVVKICKQFIHNIIFVIYGNFNVKLCISGIDVIDLYRLIAYILHMALLICFGFFNVCNFEHLLVMKLKLIVIR